MKAIGILAVLGLGIFAYFGFGNSNSEETSVEINTSSIEPRSLSEEFKSYWYAGDAEITSYKLSQERYGELREGTAVNIFVTEEFLPEDQVKADRSSTSNIPVLKLNRTKKYLTGIYPYSVMSSTFSPVSMKQHLVKSTFSMQEWCGQAYVQLNNRDQFEIMSHSYFEGEADQKIQLSKSWTENELWNLIRINPAELPIGEIEILPDFEYFRMSHTEMKAAKAIGTLNDEAGISTYSLSYPELNRELKIIFENSAPFAIEGWEEKHPNGLTTTAFKIERIKTAYWNQNSNRYSFLRDSLGL